MYVIDTYIYGKRPISTYRDLYVHKETYIYERDLYLCKETHIYI